MTRLGDLCLAFQVAIAALLLLLVSEQVHPLVPLLAALAFPFTARWRHDLGLIPYTAILGLPVGLSLAVWPVAARGGQQFNGSFHTALVGLGLAALQLWAPRSRARTGWALLGTGLAIMATSIGMPGYVGRFGWGSVWLDPRPLYELVTVAWALAALVTLRGELPRAAPRRRRPWLPLVACALLGTGITVGLIRVVDATYDDVSQLYFRMMEGAPLGTAGGFSDQAQLGSLSAQIGPDSQAVAVRAFSPGPPGYLRGKAFQAYVQGRWTVKLVARELRPQDGRVLLPGREPPSAGSGAPLEVHPDDDYGAHFFLPLEAAAVETGCDRVAMTAGGALRSTSQPTSRGYEVHLADAPWRDGMDEPEWREQPADEQLLAALDEVIAAQALRGQPPREVVRRLERWFDRTYTYRIGIEFRPGSDPLVQWLREHRHGHCELFASAGTLLLRRLGIPARYVTGFICTERHPWEPELWVARRAHAHAWVEWADPERGWQLAELTPASAIAGPGQQQGRMSLLREWLAARWDRIAGAFRGGLAAVPAALLRLARQFAAWVAGAWYRAPALLLLLLAGPLLGLWRRRRRRQATRTAEAPLPPHVEAERRRFLALEARLRRAGLGRGESETLLEYAGRLEGARLPEDIERSGALALVRGFAGMRYT